MGFLFITALIFLFLGICGLVGGFIMLSIGHLLARIDAFGITPFQGAIVCVGFVIAVSIIIERLLRSAAFSPIPFWDEDEEEEYDDVPIRMTRLRQKKRQKKRR